MRSSCPINYALEIFGDRWTLIVLRDILLEGKCRFRELLACDEKIATNLLSNRLKRLEDRGLIAKQRDPGDARQYAYRPTAPSLSLVPMLVEMTVWGAENNPSTTVNPDFIQRFREDREGLINEIREKISREHSLSERP